MSIEVNDIPAEYQADVTATVRGRRSLINKLEVFRETSGAHYDRLHSVLVSKQSDYGPGNIASAPGGAINGLLVRMNDKMQRLINLNYNQALEASNESIRDSYEDLANYCVIALMVLDGEWEGVTDGNQ